MLPPEKRAPRFQAFARIAAGLVFLLSCHAATEDDPQQLLAHIRQNILDTIRRLPRYVCRQTVDRTRYEPGDPDFATRRRSCDAMIAQSKNTKWRRRLSSSDRLRLDVVQSNGTPGLVNEMYSWAGEDRFGSRELFDFVRDGAVSTGSFASMLASIFGKDVPFSYNGDTAKGPALLSEFGFDIPLEKSSYQYVLANGVNRRMAYEGTILADSNTADLVRLELRAYQPPPETGVCQIGQSLDYGRVTLNDSDFLLPREARVSVLHTDGTEADNVIRYSDCHEFHSDVTVRYEPTLAHNRPAPLVQPKPRPLALPAGAPFKVTFTDRIDTATAAAGDPIHGRLKTAIREQSGDVLIPEGTPVTGRILRVKRYYDLSQHRMVESRATTTQPSLVVDVRLETLEMAGVERPFKAAFDSGIQRRLKQPGIMGRVEIGSFDQADSEANSEIGTFPFWDASPQPVVKAGLESSWVTVAP